MYELHQVGAHCYYIQSPAKIGLIRINDTEVCLIDSGNDKDAGKKVLKLLNANGWRLTAVYNTHSNADHIGGNAYLQKQTGCKVYAPGIECAFTRFPLLEPSFLYGGFPPKELRHKFLMAPASGALALTEETLPKGLSLLRLPGHFFDMVGFCHTEDNVVYLADCLSSKETLDKYQIGFIYDVKAYLETLEAVMDMQAAVFVPAHAEPSSDMRMLARYNRDKVLETAGQILTLCRTPMTFEALLKRLFDAYALTMTFEQYALVGSTVRSYLAYLSDAGKMQAEFAENELLWHSLE